MSRNITVTRSGNTLVVALGILSAVAAMVLISTNSAMSSHKTTAQVRGGIEALGAVELVLAAREQQVNELANLGDPVEFARWKEHFSRENYGVDFVGNCEVRWKIEPCITAPKNDPSNPTDINFIANPNPDPAWTPTTGSKQQVNDNTYLFKISAEGNYLPDASGHASARAQGVRFAVVNKEPLFRYVIFYAQSGPKGDLELTHEEDVTIQGNVHTNGALYVGSKSKTNTFAATNGPSGKTVIGPVIWRDKNLDGIADAGETNLPVRVTGVDGIFRLSKQLMYGALNGFPMELTAPSGWSEAAAYDAATGAGLYPRDVEVGITAAELGEIAKPVTVRKVKILNPYRVTNQSAFITTGQAYSASTGALASRARVINLDTANNPIPILGVAEDGRKANDARDGALKAVTNGRWVQYSGGPGVAGVNPQGFAGYVRTDATGGRVKKLPKDLSGVEDFPLRPLERQQVIYSDFDGDPSTDQHELAQPIFTVKNPTNNKNPAASNADFGQVVEIPGKYLGLALGDGNLARKTDGSGWDLKSVSGTGLGDPLQGKPVGLTILERPVPDTSIWPGTANIPIVPPSSPDYLPYAYGKHWRPSFWPYFAIDVSEGVFPGALQNGWAGVGFDTPLNGSDPTPINIGGASRRSSYSPGGTLAVTAACREGEPAYTSSAPSSNGNRLESYPRTSFFYNDNWRFYHMKRPQWAGQSMPGVRVSYFKDTYPKDDNSTDDWAHYQWTFGGQGLPGNGHVLTGTPDGLATPSVIQSKVALLPSPLIDPVVGNTGLRCSMRFEGFVVPRYSEVYTFIPSADDGIRMWLDGVLITPPKSWANQGVTPFAYTTTGPLTQNKRYHVVIDYYQGAGGAGVALEWKSASQSQQEIPSGTITGPAYGWYQPEAFTGFDSTNFDYVQCQIDVASLGSAMAAGVTDPRKVGLMIRDGNAGLSPLLSGRDSYVAILYNPTRGFFTQRRLSPSFISPTQQANFDWFVGTGATFSEKQVDSLGAVSGPTGKSSDAIGMANALYPINNSGVFNDVTYTYTNWNRTSRITRSFLKDTNDILINVVPPASGWSTEDLKTYVSVQNGVCDPGDGNPFSVKYGFSGAVNTAKWIRRPIIGNRFDNQRDVRVALSASSADFPNAPIAFGTRYINVYDDLNTQTTNNEQWSANGTYVDNTHLAFGFRSNGNTDYTYGDPVTTTLTVQDNWVYGASAGQIAKMNSSGFNGRSDWVDATLGGGWLSNNEVFAPWPALDWSTCPTPNPPPAPAITQWNDTNPRSFAVRWDGSQTYVLHDVNSYVSSYGIWSPTLVPQYLPWNPSWSAAGLNWTTAKTYSYRPDMWDQTATLPAAPNPPPQSLVSASRWKDDQPNAGGVLPALGPHVFVRIEKTGVDGLGNPICQFRYYSGPLSSPAGTDFTTIRDGAGVALTANLAGWSKNLLIGPCVQSGSTTSAINAVFDDAKIKIIGDSSDTKNANPLLATPDGMVDYHDWDTLGAGTGSPIAKYYASQYQVLFGKYDITEDFFNYLSTQPDKACASEEWFYSPREFWSQSRRWEDGTEKDSTDVLRTVYAGHDHISNRMLLSKTTILSLNMGSDLTDQDTATAGIQAEGIQGYLRCRDLSDAVRKPFTSTAMQVVNSANGKLSSLFNGLLYASRTNRYPWNTNRGTTVNSGLNPWNFYAAQPLPNTYISPLNPETDMISLTKLSMSDPGMFHPLGAGGVHKLQPYDLVVAPPFKPQDFSHGVRIYNASNIYWGYSANKFGESKMSIASPNALYVQGDVNTVRHSVSVRGVTGNKMKNTPLAIFGDSINLESNNFNPINYQIAGLDITPAGVISGTGYLANPTQSPAIDTTYVTCFLTHNIPTTRDRVKEGQSAAFIDTMMFNENWSPGSGRKNMNFTGSLVVMDSRRYTRAFLLDVNKKYGRTVLGTLVSNTLTAGEYAGWNSLLGTPDWIQGSAPSVYQSPIRNFTFNDDLLTPEGTPPFTPFGVTSSGVGGWVRIVE